MNKILIIFDSAKEMQKFIEFSQFAKEHNLGLTEYNDTGAYAVYLTKSFDAKRVNDLYCDMIVKAFDLNVGGRGL